MNETPATEIARAEKPYLPDIDENVPADSVGTYHQLPIVRFCGTQYGRCPTRCCRSLLRRRYGPNCRINVLSDIHRTMHDVRMWRRKRIGFLVFDGITALDLVGPAEAFAAATAPARAGAPAQPAYEVLTLGLSRRACVSESGVTFVPSCAVGDAPALDTLIIPGGSGLRRPRTNLKVTRWLQQRASRIRRVASVCTGIYGLAPSGLLDGLRATTHWRFAADVAARFPRLKVVSNELFVKSDRFYSAAGVTAGIDLALALIEEDLGASAALAVARELVVYLKREGGQAQFSEPLQFQSSARDRFGDLAAYVAANLQQDLRAEALARKVALSPRQFSRRCRENFGCSPAALVRRLRLDEARRRLHAPRSNVEIVAASVGFNSADAFRRAFEQHFGVNPSTYRSRFLSATRSAQATRAGGGPTSARGKSRKSP
jgi:transcriptional regulator GlxA family with amidase domain